MLQKKLINNFSSTLTLSALAMILYSKAMLVSSIFKILIQYNLFSLVGDRMTAERLAAERMSLATDPLVRLQMAGITPEVNN